MGNTITVVSNVLYFSGATREIIFQEERSRGQSSTLCKTHEVAQKRDHWSTGMGGKPPNEGNIASNDIPIEIWCCSTLRSAHFRTYTSNWWPTKIQVLAWEHHLLHFTRARENHHEAMELWYCEVKLDELFRASDRVCLWKLLNTDWDQSVVQVCCGSVNMWGVFYWSSKIQWKWSLPYRSYRRPFACKYPFLCIHVLPGTKKMDQTCQRWFNDLTANHVCSEVWEIFPEGLLMNVGLVCFILFKGISTLMPKSFLGKFVWI